MIYFFSLLFQVASAAPCEFSVKTVKDWQVQTIAIDSGKRCLLKLSPRLAKGTHRKYIFNDEGMAMIFIDSPKGSAVSNTASYGFFLLPTTGKHPSLISEDPIEILDSAGVKWKLIGDVLLPQDCKSSFSQQVKISDAQGFSIESCERHYVVSNGYLMGEQAITDSKRSSKVTAPKGQTCVLKNAEIFDYSEGKFEVRLKKSTKADWESLLRSKKACAKLLD